MLTSAFIKRCAAEAGFDLCGIADPEIIPKARRQYNRWLEKGYQAEMAFLSRDPNRRTDPSVLMSDVRSIVVLGLNYYQTGSDDVPRGFGRVSRYARGRDYHKVIEKMINSLIVSIKAAPGSPRTARWQWYVDYGPMLERSYAEKAGLGFIGKNGMLINRKFGSWIFLAEILTNLELEKDINDPTSYGRCSSCRLCLDACPTGAILSPRKIDSSRCISYLTVERPTAIPDMLGQRMGNLVFGCDICQEVCPFNDKAIITSRGDLLPKTGVGQFLNLHEVIAMQSRDRFLTLTAGTALTRPKLEGLKRSAEIVLRNQTPAGR